MTVKQEQQAAQTTVEKVAPGALRMQLPIAIPGLRHVNMYCFPDERGATVIDPGLPGEDNWQAIRARLKEADLEVRHIHTVLITHSHPDHFGGAARIHAESGARVVVHEDFSLFGERPHLAEPEVSIENLADEPRAVAPERDGEMAAAASGFHIPWGGPGPDSRDQDQKEWEKIRNSAPAGFRPPITHVVRHGDVIALGGRKFRVVHSPGHTGDHICFYDREAGTLLAGDHILPSITPHISGLNSIRDPLQTFYDSLERILELGPLQRCLPAHGDPFDDIPGRIVAIQRHHRERLDTLVAITKQLGPASVRDLSRALFKERSWGIMAESETYAHLEHLRLLGQAESRRGDDGLLLYDA
jgi:glyoxylase-like metal-dependent hydrolase (beta-lactamase superfamily II)